MRLALLLCLLLITFDSAPVSAANATAEGEEVVSTSTVMLRRWQRSMDRYTKLYDEVLDLLNEEKKLDYNVHLLRSYYPRSEYYEPFAEDLLDDLTLLAQTVQESDDIIERRQALEEYKSTVTTHLGNLEIAMFAETMSQVDPVFGDSVFYTSIVNSLIRDLTEMPGNCENAQRACRIVSYGEETYLLASSGGIVKKSELLEPTKNQFYNVHDLIGEDGTRFRMFIDVSAPITNMQNMQKLLEYKEEQSRLGR